MTLSDPLAIGLVAFSFAAILTPVVARLARRWGMVAPARPDRWGARPTPLLGGVAIALALTIPALIVVRPSQPFLIVCGGAVAAFLLGLLDDLTGLRPTSKLVGQVAIASGLAAGGVRAEISGQPVLDFLITLFWVVTIMNAINLMDNMDGLATGTSAIAAFVLLFAAPEQVSWAGALAATTAGACLGFLVHNFAPARVYMGDAGSMCLGFVLAALGLTLTSTAASNLGLALLGPILALGLPIFDTSLVTLVRRLEGRPVSRGGRDHTSHRLAALGLSERATVLILYGVAGAMALLGLVASAIGFALLPLFVLLVVMLILFGIFLAGTGDRAVSDASWTTRDLLGAGSTLVRYGAEIGLDVVLAVVALFSAYLMRFEADRAAEWMGLFLQALPIVVPLQLAAFVVLGVYRILWRFLAPVDLVVIGRAALAGTVIAATLILYPLHLQGQSRGAFLIDAILLAVLVAGSRVFLVYLRHWFSLRHRAGERRVLIVGANGTGQLALQLILRSTDPSYYPAGFLDDDPGKHRRRISGVPVLGRVDELDTIARRGDLVVHAHEGRQDELERVRASCLRLGLELREFARPI